MAFSTDFYLKHWLSLGHLACSITIGFGFIQTAIEPAFAQELKALSSKGQFDPESGSVNKNSDIATEESTSRGSVGSHLLIARQPSDVENDTATHTATYDASMGDTNPPKTPFSFENPQISDFVSNETEDTEAELAVEEQSELNNSASISVGEVSEEQQPTAATIASINLSGDRSQSLSTVAQVSNPASIPPPPLPSNNQSAVTFPLPSPTGTPAGLPVQWTAPTTLQAYSQSGTSQAPVGGGTWVMVWIPYGASMNGATGGSIPAVPTGYYPGWIPYGMPLGTPASSSIVSPVPGAAVNLPAGPVYPVAMPQQTVFQPISPQGYWTVSPGYGYPSLPPAQPAYPQNFYNPPVAVSTGDVPLTVPAVPSSSTNIPVLPAPPSVIPPVPVGPNSGQIPSPASPNSGQIPSFYAPVVPISTTTAPVSTQSVPLNATTATSLTNDIPREPITEPNLDLQGLYILQGDDSSARARLSGSAFLTPNLLVGGVLDVVTGPDLTNDDGLQLTELYLAASLPGVPGLRLRFGQLDLTSYFDRNSFAKDTGRDFFNSTFHTNPALIAGANATASRPAGLVQWAITDNILLSGAVFSSDADIGDFALNGFAGEASFRTGDFIVRGTFVTSEDSEFQGTGERLESYGINAEWFIPNINVGLFGRYGHLENNESDFDTDTYSFGLNVLDVFMEDDRLGLGYGRSIEFDEGDDRNPDVLEFFYDFELLPNIRAGFTLQQRNSFSETYAGFRIRTDLDLTPSISAD